eukprot:3776689-Rhodomonas_salina.2
MAKNRGSRVRSRVESRESRVESRWRQRFEKEGVFRVDCDGDGGGGHWIITGSDSDLWWQWRQARHTPASETKWAWAAREWVRGADAQHKRVTVNLSLAKGTCAPTPAKTGGRNLNGVRLSLRIAFRRDNSGKVRGLN